MSRKSVSFEDGATVLGEDAALEKSVSFQEDATIIDQNGDSTEAPVDDVAQMMDELSLKKKKKKSSAPAPTEGTPDDPDGIDLSGLKKKKKKKKVTTEEDFEAKLKEAGQQEDELPVEEGDMEKGTGIWASGASQDIPYNLLLSRFFTLLRAHHPDLAGIEGKNYKIPPPQCLREGNKKTIFANIAEICKRMKRTDEHMTQFLFTELGTSGSTDGSRRLVIKGRFQQKQIENVLRRYIVEYVSCKTCHSLDTELNKGENRLYFITCNSCGSRRSVQAIRGGFSAQIGKRKRQQG